MIEENNKQQKIKQSNKYHLLSQQKEQDQTKQDVDSQIVSSPPTKKGYFIRLLKYTLRNKCLLFIGNVSMLLTSLTSILIPYISGQIIDDIKEDYSMQQHLLWMAAVMIGSTIFSIIRGFTFNLLGERVIYQMKIDIFNALVQKDIQFYDVNKSGDLISRLTSDVTVIQGAASDNLSILLRNLIQFFGSLLFLWVISYKLTLVMLVIAPFFTVLFLYMATLFKKYKKMYQDDLAFANQTPTQVFSNIRIVKSFATELRECKRYIQRLDKVYYTGWINCFLYGTFMGLIMIFGNGMVYIVLAYGGHLVKIGDISIGQLTSYVLYAITMTVGLVSVSGMINQMISALGVCQNIFNLIDLKIQIRPGKQIISFKNGVNIKFENIVFQYPSKQNVEVLKGINFSIENGECIGIVGASGEGKSSIISLIQRFYDIKKGRILFNNKDIKSLNLQNLRQQIGLVSQQPTLFSGSIRQNVAYGISNTNQKDIEYCLKLANAFDFINNKQSFPDGLDTLVGQRGVKLSGGQKQRIAIARSLMKNPNILIFDQATSALDSQSEHLVQMSIDELIKDKQKTILIIAHRLSTIKNCDRILVLKNGIIVQQGKHQMLVDKNGYYKALIQKQLH